MSGTLFLKCKQHTIHDPRGPETYNYTLMKYGATFYNTKYYHILSQTAYFQYMYSRIFLFTIINTESKVT